MEGKIKKAIEIYQCPGCVSGYDTSCFEQNAYGVGCEKHLAGTIIIPIGKIILGMPKGFNRLGLYDRLSPRIWEKYDDNYDKWNIPVWKYLDENGYTLVRGMKPRVNEPFIDIFLENCIDKISCLEIKKEDIEYMD